MDEMGQVLTFKDRPSSTERLADRVRSDTTALLEVKLVLPREDDTPPRTQVPVNRSQCMFNPEHTKQFAAVNPQYCPPFGAISPCRQVHTPLTQFEEPGQAEQLPGFPQLDADPAHC